MQKKNLVKLIILAAFLVALFALGKGFFYFDNDEADSGLAPDNSQIAQVNGGLTPGEGDLPVRLLIPKLEIDAEVQRLGVTSTGNMAAPNNFTDVSWYKHGTVPGFKGSAVVAGHVDNALGTPAIFYELPKLELGDSIYVTNSAGEKLHFQVIDKEIYRYDQAPAEKIFNDSTGTYLNLITCQGDWVPEARSAENRLVVYTKLVE